MSIEAIFDNDVGSIVAPAGCGKTQLITDTLVIKPNKPYLVLTHTTAGVAALKLRLKKLSVPTKNFFVTTIDGWALKLAKNFPASCPVLTSPENPRAFYPELRRSVLELLQNGNVNDILRASYSRLLVDEYQDCNFLQHQVVTELSSLIPTTVFGDPMQCIFNFAGRMPDWNSEVQARFPLIHELTVPWRWNNAGSHGLGLWVLDCRNILSQGNKIDLSTCPGYVHHKPLVGVVNTDLQSQQTTQYDIFNRAQNESLLVIGDSINARSRHKYAQSSRNIDVVEPVQLDDVANAARSFDSAQGIDLVDAILTYSGEMMTNVQRPQTLQRLRTIQAGRNRTPITSLESALFKVLQDSSRNNILAALQQLESKQGAKVYRKAAFAALKDTISLSSSMLDQTILDAASSIREQLRLCGDRRIPQRAIGSTLLLKGLECDHSLILNADNMNAQNLYVALSRAAKSVTVFSQSNFVGL
ncbi:UvrD-helicase domain-containing protein [Morganella morganii]|nr:AAA family ATPase [Morganella morganii]HCT1399542.1 AAA family ATPase [Morganella morganii]